MDQNWAELLLFIWVAHNSLHDGVDRLGVADDCTSRATGLFQATGWTGVAPTRVPEIVVFGSPSSPLPFS